MNPNDIQINLIKEQNRILKTELRQAVSAIIKFRKEYAMPVFVKMFGRKVSLDIDDPLYPYCPFRLKEEELVKYLKTNDSQRKS